MPELPKRRKGKKPARAKTAFKKDGSANLGARIPFHNWTPEYHSFYDTQAWRRIRKSVRQKYPICPVCAAKGKVNAKEMEVDHIIPFKGDWHLFVYEDNLWAICSDHHYLKTQAEVSGVRYDTPAEWIEHLVGKKD